MIFWRVHSVCSLCAVYIRRKRFLYACELWIHSCCCCCCVRNRYDSDRCVDRWLWAALLLPLLHQCAFTWLPLFVIVVCMWYYFWFHFGVSASYFFAALNRWLAICFQTLSIEMELWIYQILCGCIISVSGNCSEMCTILSAITAARQTIWNMIIPHNAKGKIVELIKQDLNVVSNLRQKHKGEITKK